MNWDIKCISIAEVFVWRIIVFVIYYLHAETVKEVEAILGTVDNSIRRRA